MDEWFDTARGHFDRLDAEYSAQTEIRQESAEMAGLFEPLFQTILGNRCGAMVCACTGACRRIEVRPISQQ